MLLSSWFWIVFLIQVEDFGFASMLHSDWPEVLWMFKNEMKMKFDGIWRYHSALPMIKNRLRVNNSLVLCLHCSFLEMSLPLSFSRYLRVPIDCRSVGRLYRPTCYLASVSGGTHSWHVAWDIFFYFKTMKQAKILRKSPCLWKIYFLNKT